ncbi:MAG: response regulator [Lachnospiraceae bacterium]|nr:response regulator [Lachnospiraceae bacterium]
MNNKFRNVILAVQIAFVFLTLVFIAFHIIDLIKHDRGYGFETGFAEITDWIWVKDDNTEVSITLPEKLDVDKGTPVRIYTILPSDIKDDYYIAFYNSRDCHIYVDDELRLSFDDDDAEASIGGICKPRWMFAPIGSADAGKKLMISRYDTNSDNSIFINTYYGDALGIKTGYVSIHKFYYFFTIILAGISSAIAIIGSLLHIVFKRKIDIVEIAIGIFMSSLWLIFDSPSFQLAFGDYYVDGPLSYMAVLLLPIPILLYVNDTMKRRKQEIMLLLMAVSLVNAAYMFSMHLIGFTNFEENIISISLLHTALMLITVFVIFRDIMDGHLHEYYIVAGGMLLFLFLGTIESILVLTLRGRVDRTFLLAGLYIITFSALVQQIVVIHDGEREKNAAIEANVQKSHFLANMSHEIRTPINSIIGMNEMILRESRDPEIKEYAHQIDSSGRLLLGLINDVLDFSKIEAGKLEIIPVEFSTADFANDIIVLASDRAKGKNLEPVFEISEKLPSRLLGDDLHIKQIIINLISNAVKYTKTGSIFFGMSAIPSFSDPRLYDVKFVIRDTGIGIQPENIDKLFDSFTRVDEIKNRSIEGTGLGLSIVKRLVDMMSGTITVESDYGKGSTFTVILPLKIVDAAPIGNFAEAVGRSKSDSGEYEERFHAPDAKLLVVDDNIVNLKVVGELLKRTQIQIDTVTGGREAVGVCEKKKYDLILMDHRMPDPDGIATLHLIREDVRGKNTATPMIVLTANAFAGLKDMYLAEGFVDYLTKPIDSALLEERVMQFLPDRLVLTDFEKTAAPQDEKPAEIIEESIAPVPEAEPQENKGGSSMSFADAVRGVAGMDYDATCEQFGGNEEFMRSLLETIVQDGREKIELMKKYLADKDYEDYGIEAHAAKSTMATIAATALSEHAKKHEFAAKENNIAFIEEDSAAFIEEYTDMLNRIEAALKSAE